MYDLEPLDEAPMCSAWGCYIRSINGYYCEKHAEAMRGFMRYGYDFDGTAGWMNSETGPDAGKWRVGVYEVERVLGGQEEGGWWYDTGTLIGAIECESALDAYFRLSDMTDIFPRTGKRNSVLGGADWNVVFVRPNETLDLYFPTTTPRYE